MTKGITQIVKVLVDFMEITFVAVAVILVSYVFAGQFLEVSGTSMVPTLLDKEQIVAEKITVNLSPITRNEIIVFKHPKQPDHLVVKRVIALPGDKITIKQGNVWINGTKLPEPYLPKDTRTQGGKTMLEGTEFIVENNSYVVLGDNRHDSIDSREWGALPKDYIIGRAFLVFRPIQKFRFIKD